MISFAAYCTSFLRPARCASSAEEKTEKDIRRACLRPSFSVFGHDSIYRIKILKFPAFVKEKNGPGGETAAGSKKTGTSWRFLFRCKREKGSGLFFFHSFLVSFFFRFSFCFCGFLGFSGLFSGDGSVYAGMKTGFLAGGGILVEYAFGGSAVDNADSSPKSLLLVIGVCSCDCFFHSRVDLRFDGGVHSVFRSVFLHGLEICFNLRQWFHLPSFAVSYLAILSCFLRSGKEDGEKFFAPRAGRAAPCFFAGGQI